MKPILPQRFTQWMERQDYDSWLRQNMGGMRMADFAVIGDLWLPSNTLEADGEQGDEKGQKLPGLTSYKVFVNKDGTVYKLVDASEADAHNGDDPKVPYGNVTHKAGKAYYLTKDEYQRLALFPKMPAPPGGAPGAPPM